MNTNYTFSSPILCMWIILSILAPWHLVHALGRPDPSSILLSTGRSYSWPTAQGAAVSVSNGAVVHVTDLGSQVKITARKSGHATLRSGSRTLDIDVVPEGSFRLFASLQKTALEHRGLEVSAGSGRAEIRGRLLRWQDWLALSRAAQGQEADYRFMAKIEPSIKEEVINEIKRRLTEEGLGRLDFVVEPSARVTIPSLPVDLKARVVRALGPFGFDVETSTQALELQPLIRVKIIVAEFRKKFMNKIGLEWPAAVEGQLLPNPVFPTGGVLALNLHAIEENGMGKVLASPNLLCRSGKEASFLAGGEFPIKIINFKTQDVVWKQYGVRLKIQPVADIAGHMSIGIETEVSMIDASQTVDGIPGLLTNRIESHFDLATSRTIALSGLIKKEWSESSQGLPGLARLPILGPLFSSHDYRDNQTELVFFVTPEIVSPD